MEGEEGNKVVCTLFLIGPSPTPAPLVCSDGITLKLAIHMLVINKAKMYGQDNRL